MSWLNKFWQSVNSKLFYKMIIIYSLLTVIPLILIISLFYFRTTAIVEEKIRRTSSQTLVETADKIDGILKLLEQQALTLRNEYAVNRILNNDFNSAAYPLSRKERTQLETELVRELQAVLQRNDMIDAAYVFNTEGDVYTVPNALEVESYLALTYIAGNADLNSIGWGFFTDNKRITSALKVVDSKTEQVIGYIAIMLKPDKFVETYASYSDGDFYVSNANNLVLSSHNPKEIKTKLNMAHVGDDMVVNRRSSDYSGFTYTSFLSKKDLNREIVGLAYYAIAITLAAWLVVFLLTFIILKHITKPLIRLSGLMRKAEREEFFQITGITTRDEIAQLCLSFNRLMEKIKYLIQQVYKVELLKKEADLKVVRMHLNPHFLYNTLESISIMARGNEASEIPKMIDMLSRILRSSIMPKNDYVPLETEIQLASSYLQLHKYRYKDKLQWSTDIEAGLDAVLVPKLILQPIVENAIKHGIDQSEHPGTVVVRAYEHQFDLVLEVEDNGPGFGLKPSGAARGLGTGLENVESRLHLLYSAKYGISIRQGNPRGTVVQIRIPIMISEREEAQ
ncbi:sensor histidine kinase [Cohnella silvisoli]|uniref:histidine kinase n=1 Tax=Cohnella silvisoli TaxID=2873699 RepID=A0ABV1L1L2_9BACL|nr:sensor histidine kinase [Cohnella silvisoli]MCD9025373.1 sensor histidine kinase [Cohnella silvisoli]